MKIFNLSDFKRGWFIGNFKPSVLLTDMFEVGVLTHAKGEAWPAHFHLTATEFNVLLEGRMHVSGSEIKAGEIFIFEPGEVADPVFHENCKILCVKVPSIPGDKFEA
jgi:hypothetical protein